MSRFFCILSAIVLYSSCFGTGTVITSDFDRMTYIKIPKAATPGLLKRNIDISEFEKMPQALFWHIGNYPRDCRFYLRNGKWGISAPENLSIYSNLCYPCSRNYLLKLDAEMPADAESESSSISMGVYRYGLINGGGLICKKIKINRGSGVSCEAKVRLDHGIPLFQVMLTISGNVILKKFTLEELPDDLTNDNISVIEGMVVDRSPLPDPQKSDYPDCRFTVFFEGNSIISGASCPQKLQLVIDGFVNRKLLKASAIKTGDKIRCTIIPFERLPEEKKTIQQSDTLDLFELTNYYVLEMGKVKSFSANSAIPFADRQQKYVSIFQRAINPPLDDDARNSQRRAIKDSLTQINQMLVPYADEAELKKLEDRFSKAWNAEKAKDSPGVNRCGAGNKIVWRNIDNSFWALPEDYNLVPKYRVLDKGNLNALLALQEFLNVHGCQLMIGIVPDYYAISARVINREFRNVPDFGSAWLIQQLLSNNLEAVYFSDKLVKEFNRYQFAFFYPQDGHPSDTTQDIMTDAFAHRLSRYNLPETLDKDLFSTDMFPHVHENSKDFLFPKNCDIGSNRAETPYRCRRVLYNGKEVFPDQQSPVLILGNSFIQYPMKYPESFPSLLASKMHMGIATNRVGSLGPMTTVINQLLANPEKYLKGKKVVILVMGIAHFSFDGNFNNIRIMDEQMLQLSGRIPTGVIPISGNQKAIPGYYKQLNNVRCFSIPSTGKYQVVNKSLPHANGEIVLVIPVCAHAPCPPAKLKVNGKPLALPTTWGSYRWNRCIVTLPDKTGLLSIELEGAPGATIALGDIQIYQ